MTSARELSRYLVRVLPHVRAITRSEPARKPSKPASARRPVHAGDLRIEAWAGTREACIAEAVDALVGSFVGPTRPPPSARSFFQVTGETDAELLRAVLARVISGVLERQEVPLATAVSATEDGLEVSSSVASVAALLPTGAIPKGVSRQSPQCRQSRTGWWCTARIDV